MKARSRLQVNFDVNVMLLDCSVLYGVSDEANFVFKWVLFLLLPGVIALRYQAEHRIKDWWARRNGKEESNFTHANAVKAGMFLMNMVC